MSGVGRGAGPPPSTLAAQLVENISVSNKSSRSDENSELKALLGMIQRVKDDPNLLKSPSEHLEHNHMLIYVYCRSALDSINLDDPFVDRAHVRAESLKTINFIRLNINETPMVLKCKSPGHEFQFQGAEPLWLWILPKLLRMLGNPKCEDLEGTIEGFLQYLLLVVARNGKLSGIADPLTFYLRSCLTGLIHHLQSPAITPSHNDVKFDLELPTNSIIEILGPSASHIASDNIVYKVRSAAHALRQAASLARVLSYPLICQETAFFCISPMLENGLALLDIWLDLRQAQRRWEPLKPCSPIPLIELALDVIKAADERDDTAHAIEGKIWTTLILLCSELVASTDDLTQVGEDGDNARLSFSIALVYISKASMASHSTCRLAASKIARELAVLAVHSTVLVEGSDLWRCALLLNKVTNTSISPPADSEFHSSLFQNDAIRAAVEQLDLKISQPNNSGSVSKRRRVDDAADPIMELLQALYEVLEIKKPTSTASLDEGSILTGLQNGSDSDRCLAIDLLSRLVCQASSDSDAVISYCPCSEEYSSMREGPPSLASIKSSAQSIFTQLVRQVYFVESRRCRVAAMIALRRLVAHSNDPQFINLETSGPGQWCLQSLNSSIRELRIASARTLAMFIPQKVSGLIDEDLLSRNRQNSIALLKSISNSDEPHLVETRIMAWTQIGRVVPDEELNLVLIKSLEYLGSSNHIQAAVAFNEILHLAEFRQTTPRRLFEPFWKSLAYLVTKDMVQRPQRSRAMAELLQISINELLLLIQSHAMPWLVLDKRKDIVQRISDARKDSDVWVPIVDTLNLPSILALLMIQESDNMEEFAISRLTAISSHFSSSSLIELIQAEQSFVATELLKSAAEAEGPRSERAIEALQWMAGLILKANKESRTKKPDVIGRFLQPHLLGIMARLADVITDTTLSSSVMQQRHCIGTLQVMIELCKSHAQSARSHISACLLSAFSDDSLREAAFSCWASMLMNFDDEDVETLLEPTFFIVNHYWKLLNAASKDICTRMLSSLLKDFGALLEQNIHKLPSLAHIIELKSINSKLGSMREPLTFDESLAVFAQRIRHDNSGVIDQALTELVAYLHEHQSSLYATIVGQASNDSITNLMRSLLDCASKHNTGSSDISRLCVQSMGLMGCIDSNQMETVRERPSIIILDNFKKSREMTDFALFLIDQVLVPSFLSATDTKLQGFLCFVMQELLERCEIKSAVAMQNVGGMDGNDIYRQWIALPERTREVVMPFLQSRYIVAPMPPVTVEYPIFHGTKTYGSWIRAFVVDLLRKGQHPQAQLLFEPLSRVIRVKDVSVAEFLLPYLVLHVLLGPLSTEEEKQQVLMELVNILEYVPPVTATYFEKEDIQKYCHGVFRILDYANRWIHARRSAGPLSSENKDNLRRIQAILNSIPASLIAQRAADCNEYARALFHLEQHAQKLEQTKQNSEEKTILFERLQDIYANIDDPDGLEGISTHLQNLDMYEQILSHKKAGRWMAAQTWYEMRLAESPNDVNIQVELLNCLKQAGQYDVLLNVVEGVRGNSANDGRIMPFAVEAAWVTGRWESLMKFTSQYDGVKTQDFNISLAQIFRTLHMQSGESQLKTQIQELRDEIATSMTTSATASLQAAHEILLKSHVLTDLEMILKVNENMSENDRKATLTSLDNRLEIIGAYSADKQYLLGIRRAAMELRRQQFSTIEISALWLSSARLARKTDALHRSFNAVLHAQELGDDSATIENAKLLWKDSHHRKAIQMLQGAIERNKFMTQTESSRSSNANGLDKHQRLLTARAQLLLAKWLDTAGQTHALALREKYQQPPRTFPTWEKGHYYLGRHYKKILEAEQALPMEERGDSYLSGEITRIVIENYLRSLHSGTKYLYQTLPRVLTLWLDLGAQMDKPTDAKVSLAPALLRRKKEQMMLLNKFLDRYIDRLPAYIFYTALPQIVARIAHPNGSVFERLAKIIIKVIESYPRQALWSLIGVMTTKQVSERKNRGNQILQTLRNSPRKTEGRSIDMRVLLKAADKLADQLLLACQNGDFHANKTVHASLTRDLHFNHKCTPCALAVPVESSLTAIMPAASENMKGHSPFSRDVVSIDCFLDDVLVLSSLAKPRRLTARGSDGKNYMLLIKPKDDLRTDQRLMEFNGLINRSLKRDAESSRRQLYIRTYAVVPLNEECGIIEWVPGIRTMRDILLHLYQSQKISPDYNQLRQQMEQAASSESKIGVFTNDVLGQFPPVLPLWFIRQFPNPSAWFAARQKYTRSCAVMSMVGTILGLGDRHGENVNLEEGSGGVFHVDFNCLFDKGLTFAKPERVPFRLTHNMVAAMGIYGYEGPFRKSSELTLRILRQQEETLITILEAFIYDPTLDLQREKRSSKKTEVRLQPQSVVDSIKRKVKGLLPNETIPLSVEGQVEELIKQAVDPRNLTAMYIGWCPFF